ncbi:NFX1-type zinc finger-containing protein 1-like isoform X2 [Mixophyes fleayi]|uniref:NFX1-type zinc finger-containing protein 1-like isoform X2 n=1 Tax=Mixophyes fleayi TaxID=3061075 RepID=UPI003F4E432B
MNHSQKRSNPTKNTGDHNSHSQGQSGNHSRHNPSRGSNDSKKAQGSHSSHSQGQSGGHSRPNPTGSNDSKKTHGSHSSHSQGQSGGHSRPNPTGSNDSKKTHGSHSSHSQGQSGGHSRPNPTGSNDSKKTHGSHNSHSQGQSGGHSRPNPTGSNDSKKTHGSHNSHSQGQSGGHSRPNPRGSNDSKKSHDYPFDLFSGFGSYSSIFTNLESVVHQKQRGRAQSEERTGTGWRLEVFQTPGGQHKQASSVSQPEHRIQQTNQARKGGAQESTMQNDSSCVKRRNNLQTQARGHGNKQQYFSGLGRLSHRQKSPPGYGSQNMSACFSYKSKELDQFSVFQPKETGFGMRAQSAQNLCDLSMYSKSEDKCKKHGFKERGETNPASNKKKIDSHAIYKLSTLEPSEVILKLAAPRSGLKEFLNKRMVEFEVVEGFLQILITAIGCTSSRQNLTYLLSQIQGSAFLNQVLHFHILDFSKASTQEDRKYLFIDQTIILVTELASFFPSSSFIEVKIIYTLLQNAFNELEMRGKFVTAEMQKNLMALNNFLQHLQEKKMEGTLRSDNYIYIVGNKANIEGDFRSLSVYPTHEDIYLSQNPSMRPNIIDGSYTDAESYLDTHFRLLREDFIRPLRDGICELVTLKSKDLIKARFDDIRIYFNTQILFPVCTNAGIVHQVKFNTENLKQVRWEISRRLLYGSLVCLSKDNFKNMLFATVADRNVSDLQNGVITLKFTDESRLELAQYTLLDAFMMIEATAYFEAFRHVLEGLKEMVESEIPFQNYIVHCSTTMSPPLYLSQNQTGYALEKLIKTGSSTEKQFSNRGESQNMFMSRKFEVLDFSTWPTEEELQLDRSQFRAFQMALTSELSIIQGPPGAGKTYVGLKIVYALLVNSGLWKQGQSPILIVCYTNHALDQFLEGILKYLKCTIVRVGSRSNSEILKECSLSNIRRKKSHQNLPGYMRAMHAELLDEKKDIENNLTKKAILLQNITKGIIHEDILEQYMPLHHFQCLMSQKKYLEYDTATQVTSMIVEWLGTSTIYRNTISTKQDVDLWEIEDFLEENDDLNGDFKAMEEKADDEFITVSDEAKLAETERMIEEDCDIKYQIRMVREQAAKAKKETLVFVLEEYDSEDQNSDPDQDDQDGWQISKKMRKKLKKQIKHELEKTSDMTEEQCKLIFDLWQLPILKRWEVYRVWRSQYLSDIRKQIFALENEYQILVNRMTELRNQEDLLILQKADIIGMTTTAAAKFRKLLQNVQPKIVIVEEAAEVLEAHIITALSSRCQHLILIGDHQQLRPSTTVYELAKNFNLEVSMFERLIRMNIPFVRLDYQHRMRPEIARLLTPHIYEELENHESVLNFDNIKGVCHNLYLVDHSYLEEHIREGKSHQNTHEAAFVKSLCLYFIQQGYSPSHITILTTYSGQLHCLQKMMPKSKFEGVRVCVVDKYQGEENEIIILSLVRSNLEGNIGFLKIPNRVCVALSRAKKGLFCIGNMQILSKVPLWSKINDVLKENGQIGKDLKLQCVHHPNTTNYVSKAEDFQNVPEGGCLIPCQYRLDCGHVCTLSCHPYDPEHKAFKCRKPCNVNCVNGHKCRKLCSESCGRCQELVPKKIPSCGHIQDVPCSMSPDEFTCKEACPRILECGHKCVRFCGQFCKNCPEEIKVTLECGHTVKTLCHMKTEAEKNSTELKCHVKCEEKLMCGHNCPGSCTSCLEQGFHMNCAKLCGIVLFCSHKCEEKCFSDCFCSLTCEKKCFHSKCPKQCIEPCTPCIKLCGWGCMHKRCTKLCWEPCDREACEEPCRKTMKCGHLCIGLCGEPCPKKCRVCDADEVKELFFGKEADPDARFVQLMDCPHFFEVTKFSEWMEQEEEDQVIKLKSCPKCSKPIKQNLRYGNLIKKTLSDLENVKEIVIFKWLNHLEMFLSENEADLRHFPEANNTVQQLQDDDFTLYSLMLVSEKIKFWQKLGMIRNKLQKRPNDLSNVLWEIDTLSNAIEKAKSKDCILEKNNTLFILALEVEVSFIDIEMPVVYNIRALISQMRKNKHTISLNEVHAELKKIPVPMDLINMIEEKKVLLNTELLRQDLWHKCAAGHIYPTNVDEDNRLCCSRCSFDDED